MSEVPQDLVFTTGAAPERTDEEKAADEVHFSFEDAPDVTYLAIRPADNAFVNLSLMNSRRVTQTDRALVILGFLDKALDEDSNRRITDRLEDREDKLGPVDLIPVIERLVKHWADNTTKSQAPVNGPVSKTTKRTRAVEA